MAYEYNAWAVHETNIRTFQQGIMAMAVERKTEKINERNVNDGSRLGFHNNILCKVELIDGTFQLNAESAMSEIKPSTI